MAAKYLHSLADENPDLRKQIGCMTGVFHIFNRNQIVSRNRIVGHGHKRVPPGSLLFNNGIGTPERESSVISPNFEMHSNMHFMEKQSVSTESFQESFSSWSPPSPFSYVNRRPNQESDESSASQYQNLDLRDIVKDSMYREARGLSHNVLVELREPNRYHNEPNELSRSKSCQFKDGFSKIYPRFSYDGQTTTPKQLKELPRLSLDSKQRSIRTLNSVSLVPIKPFDSKSNLHSRNLKSDDDKDMIQIQTKPPNVVAKLMGLETFSNSTSTNDNKDLDLLTKSLKASDHCDSIKPKIKPISRVHIEPAPWKHKDSGQNPQKPSTRVTKSSSVYSEVDKRLKNLEFEQSGKDLRALKHILESMQAVEARNGERDNVVDHQKPPSENVSRGQESHIVIMKPGKVIEKGFINNKVDKDPITKSTNGERQSRVHIPSKDSFKPRKQSESRCPNRKRQSSSSTQEKSRMLVKVDESLTPEYPSPVSVLDDLDKSPSPVKHKSNTQKDYAKDQYEATNELISSITSQINREKLQKVEDLIKKLKRLNSSHNEAHTDYIASLCENTNPNNRYISEIFLASGLLLRDLESFEFHSPGHPVNPELFLVLERTKFGDLQKEMFHRKLIFDAVNEILVEKLNSVSFMVQNPRELLREVCLEIEEGMQVEKKGDEKNWVGFYGGCVVVAMEVEWLIFRDLVNELVVMS